MAPLYEYKCPDCDLVVERLVAMDSRDEVTIPCMCGTRMERVVTAAKLGKPPHRTQAILGGGQKVKGDWGKVK